MKLAVLAFLFPTIFSYSTATPSYSDYHRSVITIEELLVAKQFQEALAGYEQLLSTYDFVFLRDLVVASQLAAYQDEEETACAWIRRGIAAGWTWKGLKKVPVLKEKLSPESWQMLKEDYEALHAQYQSWAYTPLRDEMKTLVQADQRKAFRVFLRITDKGQTRAAERIAAPQSEQHVREIERIMNTHGYPGEQLIGNNTWGSMLLSHHNSISQAYTLQDELYPQLRPLLQAAWERGELSPYEWALMEDWRKVAVTEHQQTVYGFLGAIADAEAAQDVDRNRAKIGLRSLALRNALFDLAEETKINFYLPGGTWQPGKIEVP
ncbi:MAG TPA: hypothetical protein DCR93_10960 [Cytophagales bacterium]|nr:hypothetical protein [Cytophagales bacterium]HAP59983.1 hypothetical protein [Cytophagales bacterium]